MKFEIRKIEQDPRTFSLYSRRYFYRIYRNGKEIGTLAVNDKQFVENIQRAEIQQQEPSR